jgi:hypothetical protein
MYFSPHWVVNGQRTSSQFDAWRYARSLGSEVKPHFYFFEDQYNEVDWTVEPSETWDELCFERCQLLRQRYKKLSLFYSAGRDSHHIIKCFYYWKIPLDEIVLINYTMNPERQYQLISYIYPQVADFIRAYPNTKVKVIDVGPDQYDDFFTEDWLENPSTALAHSYFQPTNFGWYVKQILHADEPNHGIIIGVDKPRLLLEDGKYYSTIIDKTLETFITESPNLEYFYYAPDMPKIHVKQSWMLLNHIERKYGNNIYLDMNTPMSGISGMLTKPAGEEFSIIGTTKKIRYGTSITNEFLKEYCGNSHSIYYDDYCVGCGRGPAWNLNLTIQNGRSKHKNNGREAIFQKLLNDALGENWESAYNFSQAMTFLKTTYSNIFNNGDPFMGTLGVYAKKYYMKDAT